MRNTSYQNNKFWGCKRKNSINVVKKIEAAKSYDSRNKFEGLKSLVPKKKN